jgi:hypothetical protein
MRLDGKVVLITGAAAVSAQQAPGTWRSWAHR